jgi:hypothetical protein
VNFYGDPSQLIIAATGEMLKVNAYITCGKERALSQNLMNLFRGKALKL